MMPPILSNFIGWFLKQTWSAGNAVAASCDVRGCSSVGVGEAPACTYPFVGGRYCGMTWAQDGEPKEGQLLVIPSDKCEYIYVFEEAKKRWFCVGVVHDCVGK